MSDILQKSWIVCMDVHVYNGKVLAAIQTYCQNVEMTTSASVSFTIERPGKNPVVATLEANDWLMNLLYRLGGEALMHDCAVLAVRAESFNAYHHRARRREQLLEFQKNELSYSKFDPITKWDTSGFDVTDA